MQILYIVRDHDKFPVWNHKLGTWAVDFDAYYGEDFNYRTTDGAKRRLNAIKKQGTDRFGHDSGMDNIRIVTRDELFKMLGVKDWAGERWSY